MQTIFFYNDNLKIYNFDFFNNKGYHIVEINKNDFSFLSEVKNNDIFFVEVFDIITIKEKLPTYLKLIFFLYMNHEFVHPKNRLKILSEANSNHTIFFLTTHLDTKTINQDLSFNSKCVSFNVHFKTIPNTFLKRNKKYNFFNRAANVKRLKIYELIKKQKIQLKDCYYTFANLIVRSQYPDGRVANNLKEFCDIRNCNRLNLDIKFLEQCQKEFKLIGDRDYFEKGGWDELVPLGEIGKDINKMAHDSYFAFVTESENDSQYDLRITEKTIRALLYKNIFLPIKCVGYSDALRLNGIETFEDIFGLEKGWDNGEEINSIELFVKSISYINNLSLEEVERIYNREDVQNRLENNYRIIVEALNVKNTYIEIENKINSIKNKKAVI